VVRDVNGVALQNQSVGFQLSIISGSPTGTVEYVETHSTTTNGFGIVTLAVGSGTVVSGIFSNISWGTLTYYLKVETDLGSGYVNMGTTQLLSVPYSLNSAKSDNATNADHATNSDYATVAGNVQTYTAGSGISIVGNVVTNTQPDQTVTLTGSGATSVTGTYPNFTISSTDNNTTYTGGTGINVTGTTISNTQPDQTVTLTGSGATSITGTYPNFTISSTDNNTTYTGGTGINVTGTTISNTQPDQTVTLTGSGATSVTGTYPNFTISSTDNNTTYSAGTGLNLIGTTFSSTQTLAQTLTNGNTAGTNNILMNNNNITGAHIFGLGSSNANYIDMYWGHIYDYNGSHGANGQVLTVHGTSPNTYVTWDTPQSYVFGNGLSLTGNTVNSVWSVNGNHIYNNNTGNVGVGITNPTGKMVVQGDVATADTIPLFEVKDKLGHTVFVVYPDSVHIYVKDTGVKSNKGGFAVSGKNTAKALTHDFLYVDPDYTRVFTGDTIAGFGVENIGTTDNSYMHLTPNNYFIGHQSGISTTTGRYNSFIGYQSGYSNLTGTKNYFIGYRSGYMNTGGLSNIFIGDSTGFSNTTGAKNVYIGNQSGKSNITGSYNIHLGYQSGLNSLTSYNVFIGNESGKLNTYGTYNAFIGYQSGFSNTTGNENVFLGYKTGYSNTTGLRNVFIGWNAGLSNLIGQYNIFVGRDAGQANTDGNSNVYIGESSGSSLVSGTNNTFVGKSTGGNQTTGGYNVYIGGQAAIYKAAGSNNIQIGYHCGAYADGDDNVLIGYFAGMGHVGSRNVLIGKQAGQNLATGTNDVLIIENSTDLTTPLVYGDFANSRIAFNRTATTYPLQVGNGVTNGNAAYLTAGGTWTSTSSKSLKDRFVTLSAKDLLSKIENLDIEGWFYKGTQEYHIGPFAEDFYNAFGTGILNEPIFLGNSLAAGDVAGVSLAAIKELIIKNKKLESVVANQELLIKDLQSKYFELLNKIK